MYFAMLCFKSRININEPLLLLYIYRTIRNNNPLFTIHIIELHLTDVNMDQYCI